MTKGRYYLLIVFVLLICTGKSRATFADTAWVTNMGWEERDYANAVTGTHDNGLIVVGGTDSYAEPYTYYILLYKTDSKGDTLWTRVYGKDKGNGGIDIDTTNDGNYIVLAFTNDIDNGSSNFYLLKIDDSGDTLWTREYRSESLDSPKSVHTTSDGGFICCGRIMSFEDYNQQAYIVKMASDGAVEWSKIYGGEREELAYKAREQDNNHYLVAARSNSFNLETQSGWLLKLDKNGDTLWSRIILPDKQCDIKSVAFSTDGGYVITGTLYLPHPDNNYEVLICKVSQNGDLTWSKIYGGFFDQHGQDIHKAGKHGYLVFGYQNNLPNQENAYIMRLDSIGDSLWTKSYGEEKRDIIWNACHLGNNVYAAAGYTESYGLEERNAWVIKFLDDVIGIKEKKVTIDFTKTIKYYTKNGFLYLQYSLERSSPVKVKLISTKGQLVYKVDRFNTGEHTHIDKIDMRSFASGLLFYSITTGKYSLTGKIVLYN